MRFKWILVSLVLVLIVSTACGAENPNVVLITLDTFRPDRVAAWGGPQDLTPNLNALAARSSVFTDCFAPAPLTLPSHATILTGALSATTGLRDNGFGTLEAGVPTLAQVLASQGYVTAAIVAAPVLNHRYGLSRGFATYDDAVGSADYRPGAEVTKRALALIRARREAPLFLWVHYFDAHDPYTAPASFSRRFPKIPYDAAVAYVDSEVGRLLKDLPPDTVLAVVSDHGESLGEHGEVTHGVFLFQSTMDVVCLLQGPGIPSGKVCATPTSLADVARTLAVLAGAPKSALRGEGVDLLTLCQGGSAPDRVFPMEAWPPFSQYRWHPLFGVTDGRYKWVRGRRDHLYDLLTDPRESEDLAAAPPAGALALRAELPRPPKESPSQGQVDPALLGLGYIPAPTRRFDPASLPDPYDKVATLKAIAQARLDLRANRLDKAVALLKQATDNDSGNPAAWFEYGEDLRRAGKPAEAIAALDRALGIAPEVYHAWTSKGNALVALKKIQEAAGCYEKALELQPHYTKALNPLAAYYLDTNRAGKALTLIDDAITAGFGNADTYLLRGSIHLAQKRNADAEKDFQAALRISNRPEETLREEADTYMDAGLFEQGEQLYLEGTRRYPTYAPNYLALGSYALKGEQPTKALSFFEKALGCDLDPQTRQRVQQMAQMLRAAAESSTTK